MIKLYSLILLFSISFTQNLIEDDITSFIESLDNKTLRLTIQKDNIDSDATLSILNEKIYFDTLSEDGTITIIDSVSITTYDFNDEIMIMETVDNTFLDIFNRNNLSKYSVVKKNIEYRIGIVDYKFKSLLTSIEFDMSSYLLFIVRRLLVTHSDNRNMREEKNMSALTQSFNYLNYILYNCIKESVHDFFAFDICRLA